MGDEPLIKKCRGRRLFINPKRSKKPNQKPTVGSFERVIAHVFRGGCCTHPIVYYKQSFSRDLEVCAVCGHILGEDPGYHTEQDEP